ncbi:MAG: FHA domain-containing protein, partial [Desulfobacterales bacterium]|nr:FHA domain-containing protein [Desulfobacterales bacterium]
RFKKQKKNQGPVASSVKQKDGGYVGRLSKLLSASGRVSLASLRKMAREEDASTFVNFVQRPVLVGSAIRTGIISSQSRMSSEELNSTQIFEPSKSMGSSISASESLKHAVYPLVKGEYPATPRGSFHIGRINGNDMIMPDYAISKRHAIIEIKDGDYYLRDAGSTNGTKINGSRLAKKRVRLKDKDVIGFARYEFTFLYPKSLYQMLCEANG